MCYSGKCNFERYDGECTLYCEDRDLLNKIEETGIDFCACGRFDFLSEADKIEYGVNENILNTLKFIIALHNAEREEE